MLAHLSEPVDRFWLEDPTSLGQFVADELCNGLLVKLENAVINGTGVGEVPRGFAATSGVQTQAHTTSPILIARAGVTKLEFSSGSGGAGAMGPSIHFPSLFRGVGPSAAEP